MGSASTLRRSRLASQEDILALAGLERAPSGGSVLLVDTGVGNLSSRSLPDVSGDRGAIDGHGSRMAMTLLLGAPRLRVSSLRHRGRPDATLQAARERADVHDLVLCAWSSETPVAGRWGLGTPLLTVRRGDSLPGAWPDVWAVPLSIPHQGSLVLPAQSAPFTGASLVVALAALRLLAGASPQPTPDSWQAHLSYFSSPPSRG
jgi:hypothetical protein